ncbi:MAG: IS256 family transposase, partial [Alkalinema sp. RU_4_3]|nr:IS256 family transposase [Alkalinema sp. RU_4_3]
MLNLSPEVLDHLLKDYKGPQDLIGDNGILQQLTKALIERCMSGEIDHQLREAVSEETEPTSKPKNRRNGYSKKKIKGTFGEVEIGIPRDRDGDYEPQIIPKHKSRFDGFDDKVIALYSRGMSTRDIESMLQELYGIKLSSGMISEITQQVEVELKAWQNRSLDAIYPIVYLDALVVKIRQDGKVINKAIHLALGVNLAGQKELLGIWITQNESSKFWLSVMTDLQ